MFDFPPKEALEFLEADKKRGVFNPQSILMKFIIRLVFIHKKKKMQVQHQKILDHSTQKKKFNNQVPATIVTNSSVCLIF